LATPRPKRGLGMRNIKRFIPLFVSIMLVLAVGLVGFVQSARANSTAQQIRRDDRIAHQDTLAGLANQYVQFAFKDAYDFASTRRLSLNPGDPADTAQIKQYVHQSALVNYGGALVALNGTPLNAYVDGPSLPPPTDPGYTPLREALLLGKPGLSTVMHSGGVPMIALGVPVVSDGQTRAVFIGYFRADKNNLQTYNERLRYGNTGRSYLIDSDGNIIASSVASLVGTRFSVAPILAAVALGHRFVEYKDGRVPMVASASPIGLGGWTAITTQTSAEFFGPIRSGGLHVALALIGLLVVAAAALFVMNHKRQMALAKAYEYKGQLLANTTHELKTPLTAIRGAAVTLGMRWRTMSAEQVDQFLGIIHRRCDGLSKLIERILLGARLEAGREVAVNPAPTDILGALRAITSEFKDVSPKHPVLLAGPEDVWINADPEALDQILGLLLENAIKYSPDGGEVRVAAVDGPKTVSISISDHGVGMSAEDREHIFEPYFRAARGDSNRFGGVGLGLSIVRHLVERSGGTITVESSPGEGSTFTVTLPKIASPMSPAMTLEGAGR
ncbi:MAG TPA: sensor histidine kinase, partial [Actinomycetota bacterium]|nr:sensor histidine kinase [Actinomycetota bacterium]